MCEQNEVRSAAFTKMFGRRGSVFVGHQSLVRQLQSAPSITKKPSCSTQDGSTGFAFLDLSPILKSLTLVIRTSSFMGMLPNNERLATLGPALVPRPESPRIANRTSGVTMQIKHTQVYSICYVIEPLKVPRTYSLDRDGGSSGKKDGSAR